MAKDGMRRYSITEEPGSDNWQRKHKQKNEVEPVPEIQGHARAGHEKAGIFHVPNHEPK